MSATAGPLTQPLRQPPVTAGYRWTAAGIIALGAIASILSSTVVNVAVPTLERVFHASLVDVQWLSTGYLLGLAAVIPASGWISDRLGTKRTYLGTLAVFVVASFLCGFGRTIGVELAFRVLQGVAGGMVMPVGMTMLMHVTPPAERGRMMGVIGIPMLLGPALGPAVAGWLLAHMGWEYIFWVNIPFCLLALGFSAFLLRDSPRHDPGPLDVIGLVLVTPGVAVFSYGVTRAASAGFGAAEALLPIVIGLLLAGAFVAWELRQRQPLLELRVFSDPAYSAAVTVSVIVQVALFSVTFVIPVFLQQFQGYDAMGAGLVVAFQGLGAAVAMPLSGYMTDRWGARMPVLAGVCTLIAVGFLLTRVNATTSSTEWALLLAVRGIGMGFCMMPAVSSAYVTIAPRLVSRATALANTVQRLMASLGVAVVATVLSSRLAARMPAIPHGTTSAHLHQLVLNATGRGFSDTLAFVAGASALALPAAMLLRRPIEGGHEAVHPPLSPGVRVMTALLGLVAYMLLVLGLLLAYF